MVSYHIPCRSRRKPSSTHIPQKLFSTTLWLIHRSAGCLRTHPSAIKAVHRQYFEAGADIATAATYQASLEGFMSSAGARVTRAQAEDLIRKGVALAIEARDEFWAAYSREEAGKRKTEEAGGGTRQRPLVAASVGCYGAAQADGSEYRGAYGLTVEEVSREIVPALDVLLPSRTSSPCMRPHAPFCSSPCMRPHVPFCSSPCMRPHAPICSSPCMRPHVPSCS